MDFLDSYFLRLPAVAWPLIALAMLGAIGCSEGYTKSGGKWTYIVMNEAIGREVRKIDADVETFRVLDDPDYACDKNHVFKYGFVLKGFDGATFELLEGNNYSRDANHIYFQDSIVLDADRDTFRVLGFPYSRDAKNIYCGNLRMNVADPDNFKVLANGNDGEGSFFYSTDDLVKRLGAEFADHEVKYDEKTKDERYRIALSETGEATDGVWVFKGPKKARRVE